MRVAFFVIGLLIGGVAVRFQPHTAPTYALNLVMVELRDGTRVDCTILEQGHQFQSVLACEQQ